MCSVVQVCLQIHLKKGFFLVICIAHNYYSTCKVLLFQNENWHQLWFLGTCLFFKAFVYFSKRLYIFRALSYFQSACIFSELFHIFKALVYFQSSFIIFVSKRFYFLSKHFYSNFLSVSQRLFIFSKCESALFIFFFQKHYSALALISGCEAHNFLIMI